MFNFVLQQCARWCQFFGTQFVFTHIQTEQ